MREIMIKLATDQFRKNVSPPVVVHYELNSQRSNKEYVDELFLSGDLGNMVTSINDYISAFVSRGGLSAMSERNQFLGTDDIDNTLSHMFVVKYLDSNLNVGSSGMVEA